MNAETQISTKRGWGNGRINARSALKLFLSALVFVGFIVGWNLASGTIIHRIVLPPPQAVVESLNSLVIGDWTFFRGELQLTLLEILAGFICGISLGVTLGLLFMALPLSRRMVYPYLVFYQAMPGIALAPLIIAWFGFGPEPKVVQATLGAFFPVMINTMVGLMAIDASSMALMRSLNASRRQIFMKYRFPNALATIFVGIKIGLTVSVAGVIVSEFLASERGLGKLIPLYHGRLRIDDMYAVIVVIAIVGITLFFLIEWADRKIVFWRENRQGADTGL